jgi:hypothetical protein
VDVHVSDVSLTQSRRCISAICGATAERVLCDAEAIREFARFNCYTPALKDGVVLRVDGRGRVCSWYENDVMMNTCARNC